MSGTQGAFVHASSFYFNISLSIFPIYIYKSTETSFQRILVTIEYFTNLPVDLDLSEASQSNHIMGSYLRLILLMLASAISLGPWDRIYTTREQNHSYE